MTIKKTPKVGQKWQSIYDVKRRIIILTIEGRWATIRFVGTKIVLKLSTNDIIDDYTKI